MYSPIPSGKGSLIIYHGSLDKYDITKETQVDGSISRYYYPPYQKTQAEIRLKIEEQIGKKLFNTYYFDRFYFPGQELIKHTDRNACEISVTVHVSTTLKKPWPIWIKTPDIYTDESKSEIIERGKEVSAILNPGDGMIYKGCERPHWRYSMPGKKKSWLNKKEDYYHQIFFHYVLQDGYRAQCAFDMAPA